MEGATKSALLCADRILQDAPEIKGRVKPSGSAVKDKESVSNKRA